MNPLQLAEQYASSQYDVNQYTEPDSVKGTGWTDCRDAWLDGYESAKAQIEYLEKRLAAAEKALRNADVWDESAYYAWDKLVKQDKPKQ